MGTVWLFFSWAKDVIFQPAVGPDVVILKSSLKGTAKASSSDMQTEHSPMNLPVVNTFLTPLKDSFLSKVTPLCVCPLYVSSRVEKRGFLCLCDSL